MKPGIGPTLKKLAIRVVAGVLLIAALCGGWAGWLRLTGNIHEVERGIVFRTAQLDAEQMSSIVRENQIKTVINLRGGSAGDDWYDSEVEAVSKAGARHVSFALSANREPSDATLAALIEALQTVPTPMLIHCEGGADRTGLASALYELVVKHRSPEEAASQLTFLYGHFPWLTSDTGAMDRTFWRVAAKRAAK